MRIQYFKALPVLVALLMFVPSSAFGANSLICSNKKTGALSVKSKCAKNETALKNRTALTGDQGAVGPQGAAGPQGATGAQGPIGPQGDQLGTITGTIKLFPSSCAQVDQSGTYGNVAILGTSYSSSFTSSGTFAIYNVKPGTYTLYQTALNGSSFGLGISSSGGGTTIASNVTVQAGQVTNVGNVTANSSCCGNNVLESGETCDRNQLNGETCISQGFAGGGDLYCSYGCSGYDTYDCIP